MEFTVVPPAAAAREGHHVLALCCFCGRGYALFKNAGGKFRPSVRKLGNYLDADVESSSRGRVARVEDGAEVCGGLLVRQVWKSGSG